MNTKGYYFSLRKKLSLLLSGVFLFLISAAQDTTSSFDEWDADGDKRIYENEFREGLYDVDKNRNDIPDDGYNEDQFYESAFDWWDKYDDQRLDETEWDFGYEHSFGKYVDGDFDAYDADSDNYISYDEFHDSVFETGYFSSWDTNADELIDKDEYSIGSFDVWDVNDDDYLDDYEFNNFDPN